MNLSSWSAYFKDFPQFLNGFLFTITLSIGAFILAMILGIFFGALSTSKKKVYRLLLEFSLSFIKIHHFSFNS